MEIIQYVELVARMRQAQRDYYQNRFTTLLQAAKQLERDVDRATAAMRAEMERVDQEKTAQQLALWGVGEMEPGDVALIFDALKRYEQQALHDALSAVDSPQARSARMRADLVVVRVKRIRGWLSAKIGYEVLAAGRPPVRA